MSTQFLVHYDLFIINTSHLGKSDPLQKLRTIVYPAKKQRVISSRFSPLGPSSLARLVNFLNGFKFDSEFWSFFLEPLKVSWDSEESNDIKLKAWGADSALSEKHTHSIKKPKCVASRRKQIPQPRATPALRY